MRDKYRFDRVLNDEALSVSRLFFSSILHSKLSIHSLGVLAQGRDLGGDVLFCRFPWNREEGDALFEGVKFEYYEHSEILSFSIFSQMAVDACDYLQSLHSEDEIEIERLKSIFLNFEKDVKS